MKNNRIAPPVNSFYSYTINITYHIVSCNLSSKQILHLSKEDSKTFVINDVSTKTTDYLSSNITRSTVLEF